MFDDNRDSCACGQVRLVPTLVEAGLAVVVEDLAHGPIVCVRLDPRD